LKQLTMLLLCCMLVLALAPEISAQTPEASQSGSTFKVQDLDGNPTLYVNGNPQTFIMWTQFGKTYPNHVKSAVHADIHVYQLRWTTGYPTLAFWEQQMKEILLKDPQAYFVIPFWLGSGFTFGFEKQNTAEFNVDASASWNVNAFGSQEWMNRAELFLRETIRQFENSSWKDRVMGYALTAGNLGEWFYVNTWGSGEFDRSIANTATFREWLQRKYANDVAELRNVWNDESVLFTTAAIPANASGDPFLNPEANRPLIDYLEYHNEQVTNVQTRLAAIVKDETERNKLVMVFYGYTLEFGERGPVSGQLALEKLLASPDVDLLGSPFDYRNRGLYGYSGSHGAMDSIRLNGKIYLGEDDYATHIGTDSIGASALGKTVDESLALLWRNFGYSLTKAFGQWWYDDSGYGTFNNARMMNGIARMNNLAKQNVQLPRQSVTEIALVVDEQSQLVQSVSSSPLNESGANLRTTLSKVGAPYDVILLSDVLKGKAESYKLLIMSNAYAMNDRQRDQWEALDKSEQTVVWLYAPGYWAQNTDGTYNKSSDNIEDLIGLPIIEDGYKTTTIVAEHSPMEELGEVQSGAELGRVGSQVPFFYLNDETGVTILGRTEGKATAVLKKHGNWNEVWFGAPLINSPALYRDLADLAGVHLYSRKGRFVSANESYVFVTVPEAVDNEPIKLRSANSVFEVVSGMAVQPDVNGVVTVNTDGAQTFVYYTGPSGGLQIPELTELPTDLHRLIVKIEGESLQQQKIEDLSPRTLGLSTGQTIKLGTTGVTGEGYYFYKDEMTGTPQWSSDAPEIASVDINGNVHAIGEGSATISVTVNGVTGSIIVQVKNNESQSIKQALIDSASWGTWSLNSGGTSFAFGIGNSWGTASLVDSVLSEDGTTREDVIRFEPLASGEQVSALLANTTIPDEPNVKLALQFYYPQEAPDGTANDLIVVGYDENWSALFQTQAKLEAGGGAGTLFVMDLAAYAGSVINLSLIYRNKVETPIADSAIDLASAAFTYESESAEVPVLTGIRFDEQNKTIAVGESEQLDVSNVYSDGTTGPWASNEHVIWESDRPDIAAVDETGNVQGVKKGRATITLMTQTQLIKSFITVTSADSEPTDVAAILAEKPYLRLTLGEARTLSLKELTTAGYYRLPSRAIQWSTQQPDIVDISADGTVTTKREGVAIVQADLDEHRTQVLIEVRKPGASLTWEDPFRWSILERLTAIDLNNPDFSYRYTGLRVIESKALLDSLTVHPGDISFNKHQHEYNLILDNATTQATIAAVPADHNAIVTLNGEAVSAGIDKVIPLNVGLNRVEIAVTAEDGSTSGYTIIIERLGLGSNSGSGSGVLEPVIKDSVNLQDVEQRQFPDTKGHWAEGPINEALGKGWIQGYTDGKFKPDAMVTRAEFAVMLDKVFDLSEHDGELAFSDEADIGNWAKAAVGRAVQAGIVKGFADGSFRPNTLLSRAEMVVMIVRLLNLGEGDEAGVTGFADDAHIPAWAKRSVWVAKQHDLVRGTGANKFSPTKSLTRAEAVVVLLRSLEKIN